MVCLSVRTPFLDMPGWSFSGRRRKLALLPGAALTLHASADGLSPIAPRCDQQWLLAGSSQFARVAKGVDLRSTARKCGWVRTPELT